MPSNEAAKRHWKIIARELAIEKNPTKCLELSLELNHAIEEAEQNRLAKDNLKIVLRPNA